jgi:hypothetical protein
MKRTWTPVAALVALLIGGTIMTPQAHAKAGGDAGPTSDPSMSTFRTKRSQT